MRYQHTGFGTEVAQRVGQGHLNRVDADLTGLDAIGLRVVEEHLGDRVAQLVLDVLIDAVDVLGEDRVLLIQLLGHLAVLRPETRQQPHRRRGIRRISRVHNRIGLALGHRTHALHRIVVGAGHHHCTRPTVIAAGQGATDVCERRRLSRIRFQPLQQIGGGLAATRRQEGRDHQRDHRALDRARREPRSRVFLRHNGFGLPGAGLRGKYGAFGLGEEILVVVEVGGRCLGGGRVDDREDRRVVHEIGGQDLTDHEMGVGAAEAEAGHAGDGVAGIARPLGDLVGHLQPVGTELDVRVGSRIVQ